MSTSASNTHAAAKRLLLAPSTEELETHLRAGAARLPEMLRQIRPDDPGAADRCEHIAFQLDGLRLQALRLGAGLRVAR